MINLLFALFFKSALVTLMTTASIGISARRVVKDNAEARIGQRLRLKLLTTSTQNEGTCASATIPPPHENAHPKLPAHPV